MKRVVMMGSLWFAICLSALASSFQITAFSVNGQLSFTPFPGPQAYAIECAASPTGPWQTCQGLESVVPTGNPTTVQLQATASSRQFYQVDAVRPVRALPLKAGVDANYSLAMQSAGDIWSWNGVKIDLFNGMAQHGVTDMRVRLWTPEDGPNGRVYATEVVSRSLSAGIDPYVVIFLSDNWADLTKQPAPAMWAALELTARAAAIHDYAQGVVAQLRAAGLTNHLYEIGNEIDYGICGVYAGDPSQQNPSALAAATWPDEAILILACEAGVKATDPDAKFLLHLAHWWDAEFCKAFYAFMLGQGVQIDYGGLSYYPSANIGGSLEMDQFGSVISAVASAIAPRPMIVAEFAYPNTDDFSGQFAAWKNPVPGYPLTPDGRRRWLADFLTFCSYRPEIYAAYYWSPEWYDGGLWNAFALFDGVGEAEPAWSAFSNGATGTPARSTTKKDVKSPSRNLKARYPEKVVSPSD